ncbi:hypothetical protein VU06_03195, partial [Desulfobulbus sp. F3]|nr:hypothetical protein [Desulfobulbus sp. F3]
MEISQAGWNVLRPDGFTSLPLSSAFLRKLSFLADHVRIFLHFMISAFIFLLEALFLHASHIMTHSSKDVDLKA